MTALTQYERLEAPAVWRAGPEDQRRDVILSLGDATLVIYDGAGRPVGHWSLAAIERTNQGCEPALYRPGPDSPEELEITAPEMVDAIERIRDAIQRRGPHRGRLRYYLLGGALAAVLLGGIFWLPGAMVHHAASVVPAAKRADLGQRLLAEIRQIAGQPCGNELGQKSLERLQTRLMPPGGRIVVLPDAVEDAAHLPGGIVLLNRSLVEDQDDPTVTAGYVLAEVERAARRDPVELLLENSGAVTAFRLLTTGDVSQSVLSGYARSLLAAEPAPVPDLPLLTRFEAADVPATPYAYALDPTGETVLGLIEADPVSQLYAEPVLRDSEWVSLQGICGE
ncbi:hypothetical protein [Psychromarinibacter sp. S121]|uniref:hypothetical protein n=1 Tax=Psychromarinibacter sp. S121 TaxID=3415127 RepID=UPI003C7B123D